MATRFAVASTSWNTPSTWDNGAVPLAGDTVYPNGFTIPIDTDISVASLNNNVSNVYLPNMAIPKMTGNTLPNGVCDASSSTGGFPAYYAFDTTNSTCWKPLSAVSWLSYEFTSPKLIKRYYVRSDGFNTNVPNQWIFEGWNGTSWDPLESKTGQNGIGQGYLSPILPHTTYYTKYRFNIIATNSGYVPLIYQFEMTESLSTSYGTGTGGSFTVPSSLSGTRNIEFTGDGIITGGTNATNTVVTIAALSGNIVNFNKTAGAYIVNRFYRTSSITSYTAPVINITGTAAVNFNGDLWGCQTANNTAAYGGVVGINAAATVTVNGNIYADKGTDGAASYYSAVLQMNATNCVVNVIGQVFSSDFKGYGSPIVSTAIVSTLNITGNLNIQLGTVVYITGTCYLTLVGTINYLNASSWKGIWYTAAANSTLSITGAITSAPNYSAVDCVGAITITIPTGIVTAGTNAVGISAPSSSLVTIGNSPLINTNGYMAVAAPKIRLYSPANVQWVFQDNLASNKVLYSAGGSIGLPLTTNVRNNIQYGASNELTGTMVVPTNPNVRLGVQVDVQPNVGTADLTAQDIFTAIATSPDPVAERLRNVSTVQTTGDQLAAF